MPNVACNVCGHVVDAHRLVDGWKIACTACPDGLCRAPVPPERSFTGQYVQVPIHRVDVAKGWDAFQIFARLQRFTLHGADLVYCFHEVGPELIVAAFKVVR